MTTIDIVKGALQSVPARVRRWMLWGFAFAVVLTTVLDKSGVPLDYDRINDVLVYIGGYLGVQSAANVVPDIDHRRGKADADHRGPAGITGE